jgi:hypothetical protein
MRRAIVLLLTAAAALGCSKIGGPLGRPTPRVVPLRLIEPSYQELFPYYAQLCAVAGHSVLYLKGVCREEGAPVPTLRMCPEVVNDVHDPRHGVGVSVNAAFKNVNWVTYPGRDLFFNGNLKRGQRLDQAHFEATIRTIVDQHLLRGVEVREEKLTGILPGTLEHRTAESLLGTDVAVRFARSIWCQTLPLERDQMEAVVDYLNGLNSHYASGSAEYSYNLYYDNCVLALHNSLAAADVWEPKAARGFLREVAQMGIPANEVIKLVARVNDFPLEDFDAVDGDPAMSRSLASFGWLPARHGALVNTAPVHRPNDLYDTSLQMFVFEGPREKASKSIQDLVGDARYIELEANLRYYQERYEKILAKRNEGTGWLPRSPEYLARRARYFDYVEAQLADVRALISRLYARAG